MTTFAELGLSDPILKSVGEMGFEEPSPVQIEAIPPLREGRDVVAQAMTGTGKTAAFGIPIVEAVEPGAGGPQAVILAPTRELAVQVSEEIHRIGRYRRVQVLPVYGGAPYGHQIRGLKRGVEIVVATPGRFMDHMRQGNVDLAHVKVLVLDEADEMLNMGFLEDVEYVMAHLPAQRQTALFSATMPPAILELSRKYMRDPVTISLSQPKRLTVPSIEQSYIVAPFRHKFDVLTRLIDLKRPERSIVFAATKRMVDELAEGLQSRGYMAEPLHGDLSQAQRERVMRSFRTGRLDMLIATDVAARGIDVENVTHVFNFDIPNDPEYYVHRIGRTGRVGRAGEAITLVNPWEVRQLQFIERMTGARIARVEPPSTAEVESREREAIAERLERYLQEGRWTPYREIVAQLASEHDLMDIAAAALGLLGQRQRRLQRRGEAEGADAAEIAAEVESGQKAARHFEARQRRDERPRRFAGPRRDAPPGRAGGPPWRPASLRRDGDAAPRADDAPRRDDEPTRPAARRDDLERPAPRPRPASRTWGADRPRADDAPPGHDRPRPSDRHDRPRQDDARDRDELSTRDRPGGPRRPFTGPRYATRPFPRRRDDGDGPPPRRRPGTWRE